MLVARAGVLANAVRVEADSDDRELLAHLGDVAEDAQLVLRGPDSRDVVLPESLLALVLAAAHDLAKGNAVLALPMETRLTPSETARVLGLSRPFVARLLDEGEIPSQHLPGSRHRLVRLTDVLEFQARRERRAEGRRRIMELAEEVDLPY
ncbi:helix-turn-helix domain-containing protein [Streptosporangium saharense]|uniref:Excisionase family DNA binding protein n=1 Tax=Streptosporangium saharense TaxID=1706840 RepID=A0A7W7VLD0_9ACTN|nr:helix-turn-helix domain-containing protein [Streptosporangium saharense]MBB4914040.1 excisionase family DNA binding protein [Streptosporangium saharense]